MSRAVLLAVTLAASLVSVARADDDAPSRDPLELHAPGDEPDGYVAGGLIWDDLQGFQSRGAMIDGGQRLGRSPWFVRGTFEAGAVARSDEAGTGVFTELRGGVEDRWCRGGGMLCGAAGLDAGVRRGYFDHAIFTVTGARTSFHESLDSIVVVPRLMIDAGGRIRFRGALELPVRMRTSNDAGPDASARGAVTPAGVGDRQFGLGYALTLGIAVGF
jgi:hypothetical protein